MQVNNWLSNTKIKTSEMEIELVQGPYWGNIDQVLFWKVYKPAKKKRKSSIPQYRLKKLVQ